MRSFSLVAVAAVFASSLAVAQPNVPLQFRVNGVVQTGGKPSLDILAGAAATDVKVVFARADGKSFTQSVGALAAGQKVTLVVGDGTAGKFSWKATITGKQDGHAWSTGLDFDTVIAAPIHVAYDLDHLDLDKHAISFRVTRAIAKAEITALGEDGAKLGTGTATYQGTEPPTAWLPIAWTQPAGAKVAKLELRVAASDGMATNVDLVPWSVEIPHEDVNFATDSFAIEPSETAKLDGSLAKIEETAKRVSFLKLQLYVAGHTDTVGPNDKNRKLSQQRALAIGAYFRKKGLKLPIVAAGFGEEVPKVPTPDNTDERANRRADYVLAPAGGVPPFKGAYAKVKAGWAPVR